MSTKKRDFHVTDKLGFTRRDIYIMIIGVCLIAFGYLLMLGGRDTPQDFANEDIFSFTRITLAPIILLLGFFLVFFGILGIRKKHKTPGS